jgi:hypothetical protein
LKLITAAEQARAGDQNVTVAGDLQSRGEGGDRGDNLAVESFGSQNVVDRGREPASAGDDHVRVPGVRAQGEPARTRVTGAHRHDEWVVSQRLGSELGQTGPAATEFEVDPAVAQVVGVGGILGKYPQLDAGCLLLDPFDQERNEGCRCRIVALDREGADQLGEVEFAGRP